MTIDSNLATQGVAAIAASALVSFAPPATAQRLASGNEGAAKDAIVRFVTHVTTPCAQSFVAPEERIAVSDNDGTLWPERPLPFQFVYVVERTRALASLHPEWKDREPFKSIMAGDVKAALAGGEKAAVELLVATHSGMTTDEFEAQVAAWIRTARHPRFNRPYAELAYRPMQELLACLRDHGFRTYIASGGGIEFMRVGTARLRHPARAGDRQPGEARIRDARRRARAGQAAAGRPGRRQGRQAGRHTIHKHIGRRPIVAFGNSDGDLEMLQWTTAGPGRRFALIVHHTDAEREWAHERTPGFGDLDKALREARTKGWIVVDMKRDWKTVYAFE